MDLARRCCKAASHSETKRIGHTGTLDPLPQVVLLVCVGKAIVFLSSCSFVKNRMTRLFACGFRDRHPGLHRETYYPHSALMNCRISSLKNRSGRISGKQKQLPTMYSAKKIDGVALHKLAPRT